MTDLDMKLCNEQKVTSNLASGSITLADGTFIPAWEKYQAPEYMLQLVSGCLE